MNLCEGCALPGANVLVTLHSIDDNDVAHLTYKDGWLRSRALGTEGVSGCPAVTLRGPTADLSLLMSTQASFRDVAKNVQMVGGSLSGLLVLVGILNNSRR